MPAVFRTKYILTVSAILWIVSMGLIYFSHTFSGAESELGYLSADFTIESEEREYYTISRNGDKVGYKSEAWAVQSGILIMREESVIKMNLAGLSREVFFQSTATIDTTTKSTRSLVFGIQSGNHIYDLSAEVIGDSLNIEVKKDRFAPWTKGTFMVNENVTFPNMLPYFMASARTENMSFMVFDPILFSNYIVDCSRRGIEVQKIDDENVSLTEYALNYLNKRSNMWFSNGRLKKADKYMVFGGVFDNLEIEKSSSSDVFRLPLEVTIGNDILKALSIRPDKPIRNPRDTEYLEIELSGIRAANIDLNAANKKIVSINPLVLGIYNTPIISGNEKLREIQISDIDTSFVGISDYIQSMDARIIRKAQQIVPEAQTSQVTQTSLDTLSAARAINTWVYENIEKMPGLDMIRSVDILRYLKGDCDEHTKLFTALARSIGIKTDIHMGLLYRDGEFKYHSWPAVFADGAWHSLDPTLGQDNADATHITLVRGDFEKLIEFLRIAGNISINVRDYR